MHTRSEVAGVTEAFDQGVGAVRRARAADPEHRRQSFDAGCGEHSARGKRARRSGGGPLLEAQFFRRRGAGFDSVASSTPWRRARSACTSGPRAPRRAVRRFRAAVVRHDASALRAGAPRYRRHGDGGARLHRVAQWLWLLTRLPTRVRQPARGPTPGGQRWMHVLYRFSAPVDVTAGQTLACRGP